MDSLDVEASREQDRNEAQSQLSPSFLLVRLVLPDLLESSWSFSLAQFLAMDIQKLKEDLAQYGQDHLLKFWSSLSPSEQEELCRDISEYVFTHSRNQLLLEDATREFYDPLFH